MVSGNRGIRRRWVWLPAIILSAILLLSGCGDMHVYATYEDAVKGINNDYFKTKVICENQDGSAIIQNEITGEYFLIVGGLHFVEIVPIQMSEMVVNPDGFTTEGEDNTNSKSKSMSVEP